MNICFICWFQFKVFNSEIPVFVSIVFCSFEWFFFYLDSTMNFQLLFLVLYCVNKWWKYSFHSPFITEERKLKFILNGSQFTHHVTKSKEIKIDEFKKNQFKPLFNVWNQRSFLLWPRIDFIWRFFHLFDVFFLFNEKRDGKNGFILERCV